MAGQIRHVYIVHHSHTDIGYTDLQEQVVFNQVHNIRRVVGLIRDGIRNDTPCKDFKWNCETYYCVEQFLKSATDEEKESFFALVRRGNIGLSGSYLNGTDLTDAAMLSRRLAEMQRLCTAHGAPVRTAMIADINGISQGARDALLDNGVEFLYTNIHTHHGMYPLYHNQTPYFWANEKGQRLLVWSGEHYNLGNALGLIPNRYPSYMTEHYFGSAVSDDALETLHKNLEASIGEYEQNGYPYDFYVTSVSGVFSDNAPANPEILSMIERYNRRWGDEVTLRMVTLDELYDFIRDKTAGAPAYRGAMNDWWGNGVGSTPYAVKHYKEALRLSRACDALETHTGRRNEALVRQCEDNALLYAEHTWGHSATVSDPCETMVVNLDLRKTSYASKAHEAAAMRKNQQQYAMGDTLRYYNGSGRVKAVSLAKTAGLRLVRFYVETIHLPAVRVTDDATGEEVTAQLSQHPRGVLVSFAAPFAPGEVKTFTYTELPEPPRRLYTRTAWVGAESVRDIVNSYDPHSYLLPHQLENKWFRISYQPGEGITEFVYKPENRPLLCPGLARFFTPVYERTELRHDACTERRMLGRNVRGQHAVQYQGKLNGVEVMDHGPVFDRVRLSFELEGARYARLLLTVYHQLPRVDFTLQLAKTISEDIESVYLPLALDVPDAERWTHNGGVAMRPGIDQLPGSNMEYYMTDQGVLYQNGNTGLVINTLDTPLVYMGEMVHHVIRLCDNAPENNRRPLYSWVMNNTWETNFKMDLAGFGEYRYTLEACEGTLEENLQRLKENDLPTPAFIIE